MRAYLMTRLSSIGAIARKDLSTLERITLLQTVILPINYLVMLSLFALSGSSAPTGVVLLDHGPLASAFYQAMEQAHTFRLILLPLGEANDQLRGGHLVAVVIIPANFDENVATSRPVQVVAQINNLEEDLTDDVHRGLAEAVTLFYAQQFPHRVPIVTQERDAYPGDTHYIPFLAMSLLVVALMVTGILQAGMISAREWEQHTIKELLLAPLSLWSMVIGKILCIFVLGLPSIAVLLAILVFIVGDWPANVAMVIATSVLTLLVFAAAGVALGMIVKDRTALTVIARAIVVPLFFLSGIFAPVSYSTPVISVLARVFPVHYATVLMQYAFKSFVMNGLPVSVNLLILCGYGLAFVALAQLSIRLSTVEQ